jgi:hypothetical protein
VGRWTITKLNVVVQALRGFREILKCLDFIYVRHVRPPARVGIIVWEYNTIGY